MKKAILIAALIVAFFSCKKEMVTPEKTEDSSQLLTRIILTAASGNNLSYEVANYKYNSAGKIIAEGNKTYERDQQQRIIRILEPGTSTNRTDTKVYYSSTHPDQVAYTLCVLSGSSAKDSVVYIHDNAGRLIKTASYFSDAKSNGSTSSPFLSSYNLFHYDENGNIAQIDLYSINNGNVSHCGQYNFRDYYNSINPQYADDEVRILELSCNGILNASRNNFANINSYTKVYDLRTDGRPRTCTVYESGKVDYTLNFEYQ